MCLGRSADCLRSACEAEVLTTWGSALTAQTASASPPQTVNTQAVSCNSSQAQSTDPQVVSAPVFQPVNSWEDSTAQAASASSPQTISSQAVSSPQAISFWEDSTSQAASISSPKTVLR